jgi:hypothetical protein
MDLAEIDLIGDEQQQQQQLTNPAADFKQQVGALALILCCM